MIKSETIGDLAKALAIVQSKLQPAIKDSANPFYVYAHQKPNGEIFYIGKGSGNRLQTTGNRSEFWKRIVKKYGFTAIKLVENLTEKESFEKEIELIAKYKALGQCVANFTIGGDGVQVEKRWWGAAISKAMTGKKAPTGKENPSFKDVISKEDLEELYINQKLSTTAIANLVGVSYGTIWTRLKEFNLPIRNSGKSKAKIKCIDDGKVFDSVNDAARFYGLFRENICKVLKGKYQRTGNRRFIYA